MAYLAAAVAQGRLTLAGPLRRHLDVLLGPYRRRAHETRDETRDETRGAGAASAAGGGAAGGTR
jgi:hypothetical protein